MPGAVCLAGSETLGRFRIEISNLDAAILWLYDRKLATAEIAALLGIKKGHVRQIIFRSTTRQQKKLIGRELLASVPVPTRLLDPVGPELRRLLGIRLDTDSVVLNRRAIKRLDELEDQIAASEAEFWSGVRFEKGLERLIALLSGIGFPNHYRRIRLLGRITMLISETMLHSGRSTSAIRTGLKAFHLYRAAYDEAGHRQDVESMGRVARLIAQAHILRYEPDSALYFADLHKAANERAGQPIRPEYYRIRATAGFLSNADQQAQSDYRIAMQKLSDTVDYGKPRQEHEVRDIGERPSILINRDWERAEELLHYMLARYPAGDIHIALNVIWAAGAGFSTDSSAAHAEAEQLLHQFRGAADGFGHPSTAFRMLELTPKLPRDLWRSWVRFSLYQNALKDS